MKTIGIDLGTTNSCVAILEGGRPVVIPNNEGARTTPSIVGFTESGDRLVGQVAKRQAVTNPLSTVYSAKRFIGRRFEEPEVQRDASRMPFKVVASDRGDAAIHVRGETLTPPEISALVLGKMKEIAEDYMGEPVTNAIITVPAYFNDAQRQATRDAGRIAGLQVDRIINEPTAAALAFGLEHTDHRRVAVYDLGGGTFDISILELEGGVFKVLATNGDTHLGGEDFDQLIVDMLANEFVKANDIDLRKEPVALQRLKEASEKAKHELSSSADTEVNLPFVAADATGPKHLLRALTRVELEALTIGLIERSLEPCVKALKDAGISIKDIDDVLLVGGMTRMPRVQQKVAEFFGKAPNREVNPDEVVAIGAAVQGAVLTGEVKDVLLLDVTPLSLGVETRGGVFTALIPRNTTVPTRKSQVFSTAEDNQPLVSVHVLQGERQLAADNQTLAKIDLVGIPPAPRGVPEIEVAFDIDANGIVSVSAKDLGTGRTQTLRVSAQSGLTKDEVERIIKAAESSRGDDAKKRANADLVNNAEGLIYTTEAALTEYASKLDPADVELIQDDLAKLKAAVASDASNLASLYQALEASAHRMAEALYSKSD
ncbi:MAG: molecular chaperone DnaK [Clostridia bacterium]|nr:molecular chaperone DnaK [Deltaproteobacteria bacterium]